MPSLRQQHLAEYSVFTEAKYRCENSNHHQYQDYGGRGIEFRFATFADFFAELGPRPNGLTLDRIDNDGHYETNNVKWATRKEQVVNRRITKLYTYKGETRTLQDWAHAYGIQYGSLWQRLKRGMSIEEALTMKWRKSPRSRE